MTPFPPGRYFLNTDGDDHWYVIPAERRAEWSAWVDAVRDEPGSWDPPEWAVSLGCSYTCVTFTEPEIK